MMRWLRRHTKQIMVVVVLFCMLAFIGGSALQWILRPNPASNPAFKAWGQTVSYGDLAPAQRDTQILQEIGIRWQYDAPESPSEKRMAAREWYLLLKEAQRDGIEVSDEEVTKTLDRILAPFEKVAGSREIFLERLRDSNARITLMDIREALRRHVTIQKNYQRVIDASVPSESEVRHFVRDTEVKVSVKYLAMDAEKFVDPAETIPEQELQAQFEAHKNADPTEDPSGMGYRLPRRVQLQYILASNSEIEPQVEISQDEAIAYWKKNKAKYTKKELVPNPNAPAASQPSSQPVELPKIEQTVEKSVSEALPDVERELRKRKAAQIAEQAMRSVAAELAKPWEGEKTDPKTLYKSIPDPAKSPDFMRSVCERVQKEFKITLNYAETPLASKEDLAKIAPLKDAAIEGEKEGSDKVGLIDYAFRNPVFLPHATSEEGGLHLQLFQAPDTPLRPAPDFLSGQPQTAYLILFRVVEAQDAAPPTSLDEVRPLVERDLRLNRAFQRAEPVAKEVLAVASHLGVADGVELFPDLRQEQRLSAVNSPIPFARRISLKPVNPQDPGLKWIAAIRAGRPTLVPPEIAGIGANEDFVDACFRMSEPGWQAPAQAAIDTPRTQAATTRPATELPTVQLLPLPKLHKLLIIQFVGMTDVDSDKYEKTFRSKSYQTLRTEQVARLHLSWFAPVHIDARCKLEELGKEMPLGGGEGLTPLTPPDFGDW